MKKERSRAEIELCGKVLGKLYDAQDDGKPVYIKYKGQDLTGVITIVQVRNDTFEIDTVDGTVKGSIWDISEIERMG